VELRRSFDEILRDAADVIGQKPERRNWVEADLRTMRCEFAAARVSAGELRRRVLAHADRLRRERNERGKLGMPIAALDRDIKLTEEIAGRIKLLKPPNRIGEAAAELARLALQRFGLAATLTAKGPFHRLASLYSEVVTGIYDENLGWQCRKAQKAHKARQRGEPSNFPTVALEGLCSPRTDAEEDRIRANRTRPRR